MTEDLEAVAAERVAARFGDDVDGAARMHAALRRQSAGFRLELLECVGKRQRKAQIAPGIVVHGPVEYVGDTEREAAAERVRLAAVAAAHRAARKDLHLG